MTHALLENCLTEVSHAWSGIAARAALEARCLTLVRHPEIGAELVERTAAARDLEDVSAETMVLEAVCEEARIDRDNGGAQGAAFLSALEETIAGLSARGAITAAGTLLLGRCWFRAGLDVPPKLQALGAAAGERLHDEAALAEIPDIGGILDTMRKEVNGDAHALHQALGEMTATFDSVTRTRFVGEILARPDAFFDRLGCYWLLDRVPHVRRAAADAFLRRARAGTLGAAIHARLVALRNWLPADDARERLDEVLKQALRREAGAGARPRPGKMVRILATIPDGSGSQSIAIAVLRERKRMVAMLLLEEGAGVKDAYVVPCRGPTGQDGILSQVVHGMDALDVSPDILQPALAAALADGIASGRPPAHGLVDVAEVCDLDDLRPEPMPVEAWIAHVDPEKSLAGPSARRFGRLVAASGEWPAAYRLIESWFESGPEVRRLLAESGTERRRETALWRHLETRRQWWAGLVARSAATLKASPGVPAKAWQSFAATALAIAGGRPLREVPIMRRVVEQTLAGEGQGGGMQAVEADEWPDLAGEADMPVDFETPAPEKKGELRRRMKAAGMETTPDWLDGYLAAVVVAPKVIMPNEWIAGALGDSYAFTSEDALQRFLDLLLMRYNAANSETADPAATGARISGYGAAALEEWAHGFTACASQQKRAWSAKSVNKDDRRILKLIADAAESRATPSELQSLLPAWLASRRATRR